MNALEEDEVMDYDSSAYDMHHKLSVEWPCLSFDILPDQLGAVRTKVGVTYIVLFVDPL